MLVERVPVSRPNTPEEAVPIQQEHDDGTPPPNSSSSSLQESSTEYHYPTASHQQEFAYPSTVQSVYIHGAHHYAVSSSEMKTATQPFTAAHHYAAGVPPGYPVPPAVRLYHDSHPHMSTQRHPALSHIYPTPPLPSPARPGMPVRMPVVEQYQSVGSTPQGTPVEQQVPDLKPLTVYTERQACTELSPPTDLSNYSNGRKSYKGLLVTVDGSIGGRRSPAPGTEAVAGGVGQRLPGQGHSRKRSLQDDDSSTSHGTTPKKGRFTFTSHMLDILEQRFTMGRYIAADERKVIADQLGIADVQVKNWFQNRRMKWKRQHGGQNIRLHQLPASLAIKTANPQVFQHTQMQSKAATSGQLVQFGNTTKLCPAPSYTTLAAPSTAAQRKSPVKLLSNAGLPAFHPHMLHQYSPGFVYNPATMQFPAGVARYVDIKCDPEAESEGDRSDNL